MSDERLRMAEEKIAEMGQLTAFSRQMLRTALGMSPLSIRERLRGLVGEQRGRRQSRPIPRLHTGEAPSGLQEQHPEGVGSSPPSPIQQIGSWKAPVLTRVAGKLQQLQTNRQEQAEQEELAKAPERLEQKKQQEQKDKIKLSESLAVEF